jgi:hypothetical protein
LTTCQSCKNTNPSYQKWNHVSWTLNTNQSINHTFNLRYFHYFPKKINHFLIILIHIYFWYTIRFFLWYFGGPVHTRSIESYWAKTKYKFKVMKGVRSDARPSYLDERMWRDRWGTTTKDAFYNLCRHISEEDPCFFVWSSASLVFRFVVK